MSNTSAPSVSVIVPTRNRPNMLSLALESIALQDLAARLNWIKKALPWLQCPAGVLSRRVFQGRWQDRWTPSARTATPDLSGADWSRRPRIWPSDGRMPETLW